MTDTVKGKNTNINIQTIGIPLEAEPEVPDETTKAVIEDSIAGNNLHGPFDSIDDLMEDVNA